MKHNRKPIASRYSLGTYLELLPLLRGKYIVAHNGSIPDARRKLSAEEAREWYDTATRQAGPRP